MWQYNYSNSDYLQHYGILGMRWGIRRFQDKSGRLTAAGKKRYDDDTSNGSPEKASSKTSIRSTRIPEKFPGSLRGLILDLSSVFREVIKWQGLL